MPKFFKSDLDKAVNRATKNDPSLTAIDLYRRKIGDVGATKLASALAGNSHVKTLGLWENDIGNFGASKLADALQQNSTLQALHLYDNNISGEGASKLADALQQNSTLQTLGLSTNGVGPFGASKLADALRQNSTLQTLDLRNNNISGEGASKLADALQRNSTLKELYLHSNSIEDVGASKLAEALRQNSTLQTLWLSGNAVSDVGASSLFSALRRNHTLTYIDIDKNKINDELERKIKRLVEINDNAGPTEAATVKEAEFGRATDNAASTEAPSPFFSKLMEADERNVHLKLTELAPLIEDVHEMKIFYTVASTCERLRLVSTDDASSYVRKGLDRSWSKCVDEDAVVIFKLILEKAHVDGRIDRADFHRYDNRAEVTRIENAPFVKSMRRAIKANAARIEGLESNVEAVNESVNSIKRGIRHKQKVEAAVGFFGAVINAVSMGVAGNLLVAFEKVTNSVVDFGDIDHMKQIVSSVGDSEALAQFEFGMELASGRADKKLEDAVKDDNALVVLSASAYLVHFESSENSSEEDAAVPKKNANDCRRGSMMFEDAELCEADEEECPLHAAVKFGDRDFVEEMLDRSGTEVNQVDSRRRTALDLAALTGQLQLMELIEARGGKFQYKNKARMLAIGKKRQPHVEAYLAQVHADL